MTVSSSTPRPKVDLLTKSCTKRNYLIYRLRAPLVHQLELQLCWVAPYVEKLRLRGQAGAKHIPFRHGTNLQLPFYFGCPIVV